MDELIEVKEDSSLTNEQEVKLTDSNSEPASTNSLEPELAKVEPIEVPETLNVALHQASMQYLSNGMIRVPLAMKGNFKHGAYGEVSFTDEDFNQIISNFEDKALGFEPYATFGHLKDGNLAVDAELKKGRAKQFEIDQDVLYVLTEPTEETLEHVQKGEYEYSSGEFIRNYKDKLTGENKGTVLMRYALTNSPFIPFNDHKIKLVNDSDQELITALSDSNRPHNISNFVFKLSLSSGIDSNSDSTSNPSLKPMNETEKTGAPVVESEEVLSETSSPEETLPTPSKSEVINQEVIPVASAATVVPTPAAATVPSAPAFPFDVTALIKEVTTQVGTAYESQIKAIREEATAQVTSLKAEVTNLIGKLNNQESITQAFSSSINQAQKQARYAALANQGIPPAFIQRFSEIESALEGGNQVIKLSNAAGEVEDKALSDYVAQLLLDALHSEPVQIEQFGQNISTVAANGLTADMQRVIQANRDLASKRSL